MIRCPPRWETSETLPGAQPHHGPAPPTPGVGSRLQAAQARPEARCLSGESTGEQKLLEGRASAHGNPGVL